MPYQPTNPYPYNTGIDLNDGLTFQFKVDNYDVINKFKIELYDLFREEKIYTIIREIGEIENETIVEGTSQIISIYDKNNNLLLLNYYEGESVLPVEGGWDEQSVCKLEMSNYLMTIEQIEMKQYYSNVDDINNIVITETTDPNDSYYILDDDNYIIGINSKYIDEFNAINDLVIPYKVKGKIVRGLGQSVFENKTFNSVIIPSSIYEIQTNAFSDCAQLQKVTFNYGLSIIGAGVFQRCALLSEIVMLDSVYQLGNDCFALCANLSSVRISSSITIIPDQCFIDTALTEIVMKNVTEIKDHAFAQCAQLKTVDFGEKIEDIGNGAFYACVNLETIKLPMSLKNLGTGVFEECNKIYSITLPFIGASREVSEGTSESLFGYLFGEKKEDDIIAVLQKYSDSGSIYYKIPFSVTEVNITNETEIVYGAFYNCENIMSIILNEGITTIGEYSFYNCKMLEEIDVPSSVTNIGKCAFAIEGGE